MSRYLDKKQQERFDKIIDEFTNNKDTDQQGLTIKVGSTIVYRQGIEGKPDVDRIKPEELEKLETSVFHSEAALGVVEIALYTPAKEEVFRFENGNVTINQGRANQRSDEEPEEDSLQVQRLNQQQAKLQPVNSTQEPSQDINNQQTNNKIYLDKEFGYISTDYYLNDASAIFGEWAKQFTPNGIYMMSVMGIDWQYFAEKYEQHKAAQAQPTLEPQAELPQNSQALEQPQTQTAIGDRVACPLEEAPLEAIASEQDQHLQHQTTPEQTTNQQLLSTIAQMQQQIAEIQKQFEEMRQQQSERLEQAPKPQENQLSQWVDGIKQNFSTTVQEMSEALRGGIDYLKNTSRELVGKGLEAATKLAVETLGERHSDGSKVLTAGNIEYRLQQQQLLAQQQDWANLSLEERLEAIRAQYGINQQPTQGEKQQQQFRDRSR